MGLFHFLFRRMCYHIFNKVDVDNSGYVEAIEVEVAIYDGMQRLYNIINKRFPGWQDPPKRSEILSTMQQYDKEGDLRLTKDEFVAFAKQLCKEGPDQFFSRVGKDAVFNTAVLPWATRSIQKGISNAGYQRANDAPLHVLSPLVGTVFKAVKAMLPIGLSR